MGKLMELCKHDLTRQFCSWCKDKEPEAVRNARLWNIGADSPSVKEDLPGPVTDAQYAGTCPDCKCEIDLGDVIAKRGDRWMCAGCAYTFDIQEARSRSQEHHPSGSGGVNHA